MFKPQSFLPGHTVFCSTSRGPPLPLPAWTLSTHCWPFSRSREQEGAESTSEEGQLPQVVEELKDLQVAPGTLLAKFQLKVKGEPPTSRGHSGQGVLGSMRGHNIPLLTPFPTPMSQAIRYPGCTGSKMGSH